MRNTLKTSVIEEAIRAMAFFGIVLFLVWPAIDLLFGEPFWSPLIFVLPVLWLPLGIWLRVRRGDEVRLPFAQAGFNVALVTYLLSLGVLVFATFTNQVSITGSILAALGGVVALLIYRWVLRRPSKLT